MPGRQSAAVDKALRLVRHGLTPYAAAKQVGIALSTIYRARKRLKESHMNFKRGTTFLHSKWLDANNAPLLCEVTKVSEGVVYYREAGSTSKAKNYFPLEQASKYVTDAR